MDQWNISVSHVKTKFVVFTLILIFSAAAEGKEQLHFTAEDAGVEKPIALPADVLAILRKDDSVQAALENANSIGQNPPPAWFSAAAIHLSDSKRPDLIVMAVGKLRGANVTTFWVFHAALGGYKLALTASAHDLIVKKDRRKRQRSIELVSMTAAYVSTVLLRFDGERYVEYKATSKAIR